MLVLASGLVTNFKQGILFKYVSKKQEEGGLQLVTLKESLQRTTQNQHRTTQFTSSIPIFLRLHIPAAEFCTRKSWHTQSNGIYQRYRQEYRLADFIRMSYASTEKGNTYYQQAGNPHFLIGRVLHCKMGLKQAVKEESFLFHYTQYVPRNIVRPFQFLDQIAVIYRQANLSRPIFT